MLTFRSTVPAGVTAKAVPLPSPGSLSQKYSAAVIADPSSGGGRTAANRSTPKVLRAVGSASGVSSCTASPERCEWMLPSKTVNSSRTEGASSILRCAVAVAELAISNARSAPFKVMTERMTSGMVQRTLRLHGVIVKFMFVMIQMPNSIVRLALGVQLQTT